MLVAVTRMQMPADQMDQAAAAFRHGAQDLKQFPGFLGFELWRNADTLEAVSKWESREAMEAYRASGTFTAHHGPSAGSGSGSGSGGAAAAGGHGHPSVETFQYDGEVVI